MLTRVCVSTLSSPEVLAFWSLNPAVGTVAVVVIRGAFSEDAFSIPCHDLRQGLGRNLPLLLLPDFHGTYCLWFI